MVTTGGAIGLPLAGAVAGPAGETAGQQGRSFDPQFRTGQPGAIHQGSPGEHQGIRFHAGEIAHLQVHHLNAWNLGLVLLLPLLER